MRERGQGCLLGQLAGDSLGSLVEFRDPGGGHEDWIEDFKKKYGLQ